MKNFNFNKISLLTATLFITLNTLAQTVGFQLNTIDAQSGYTLFTPLATPATYLIDNCGKLVHQWDHETGPGLSAYLLPNGQLLRTGRIETDIFNNGGSGGNIQLIEWDGTITWDYDYSSDTFHQHHDVEYLPNGNILVLAWRAYTPQFAINQGRDPSLLDNEGGIWMTQIVELQPIDSNQANIVWEWNLADHLVQDFDETKNNFGNVSQNPQLININYIRPTPNQPPGTPPIPDWIHANSIDYNEELDQVLISCRNFSEIWIIDHSTTTAEAASHTGGNSGKGGDILYRWGNPITYDMGDESDQTLFVQHDANWIEEGLIDEGKILVFNNGSNRPDGSYSSVDVINPPFEDGSYKPNPDGTFGPQNLDWEYIETTNFYSKNISGAQRLPNGNTLICQGADGRLFEVDYNYNIVWEYINPVATFGIIQQGAPPELNSVFRTYRYPLNYSAFSGISLQAGEPIEIDPLNYECETPTNTINPIQNNLVQVTTNNNFINIQATENQKFNANLFNLLGQTVYQNSNNQNLQINLQNLVKGIYVLQLSNNKGQQIHTQKIIIQ